ncbi:MAG: altronate dehydratase family protein, partial [Bifidobacteriaceae bacterium]|nr:altronate dehydratase family protein [Bifidobacteriaceae bacterium]
MNQVLKINYKDNVVVALTNLTANQVINLDNSKNRTIKLLDNVKQGHKIAVDNITKGQNIIKYGWPIGHASQNIKAGQWIHTHNLKTNLAAKLTYKYTPKLEQITFPKTNKTFLGFKRFDGQVGVRNDIYIVPTVGCINSTARQIVNRFLTKHPKLKSIDNITILEHPYGCSQLGDDLNNTRQILADAITHPNAAGVLVFGLGCENNTVESQIKAIKNKTGKIDSARIKFLISQKVSNEVETGVLLLEEIYQVAQNDKRQKIDLEKLKIGLKCGGSDGFSGITANPLLGQLSDYLICQGGSTVLTEVPEMFGAENI